MSPTGDPVGGVVQFPATLIFVSSVRRPNANTRIFIALTSVNEQPGQPINQRPAPLNDRRTPPFITAGMIEVDLSSA
jgi:hypothetical protein